jgi:hypothetical protein
LINEVGCHRIEREKGERERERKSAKVRKGCRGLAMMLEAIYAWRGNGGMGVAKV